MHMVSKRDLNSAELETMRTSRSPTTAMTANGEVQTRGEATVYVKELDLFVTVMLLEDTPAVLSLGELCEPHLITNGTKIECNTANYVPIVPGLSALQAQLHLHLQHQYPGSTSFYRASRINKK